LGFWRDRGRIGGFDVRVVQRIGGAAFIQPVLAEDDAAKSALLGAIQVFSAAFRRCI